MCKNGNGIAQNVVALSMTTREQPTVQDSRDLIGHDIRTVLVMAHRIWKETKQHPGTAGPGNMLGC